MNRIVTRGLGTSNRLVPRGYGGPDGRLIRPLVIFHREAIPDVDRIAPTRIFLEVRPTKDE